ncbi:hypothetical protein [Sphingomonas sp. IW22]|uniref:hypothetical protein n=1 Tax=Sphingomonas sp. IW22 TaxID=3242489 RepID=UPI003522567D
MRSFRPALFLLPLAALAACSGEPEVPAPEGPDLNLTEEMATPEPLPTLEPTPSPTPSPTPTFEAAPPPEVEEDQQMLDDAEATGMTARIDRSAENEPENLLAPVRE